VPARAYIFNKWRLIPTHIGTTANERHAFSFAQRRTAGHNTHRKTTRIDLRERIDGVGDSVGWADSRIVAEDIEP